MSHLRCRSSVLAQHLYAACCCTPEDRERIASTGQLLPGGTLKFKAVREKLSWVKQLSSQRFFTVKRVQQAIRQILEEHQLQLPSVPGFSLESWITEQTKALTKTLQRARKSTAMDPSKLETQAWDPWEDWIASRMFVVLPLSVYFGSQCIYIDPLQDVDVVNETKSKAHGYQHRLLIVSKC